MAIGAEAAATAHTEVIYIGDPMCSWCWGISTELLQLQDYCKKHGLAFRVVVGGLRPGGGDTWNQEFKEFLRRHWQEISKLTGREFKYGILDLDSFDYDTEPACRSVVAARPMLEEGELEFFVAVQRKFYVGNEDPKINKFYESLCTDFGLDYEPFIERFESSEYQAKTRQEFELSRSWGVTGFPTVLLQKDDRKTTIATGFSTFENMKDELTNH
jgi:putative protein-disulfide isomerase